MTKIILIEYAAGHFVSKKAIHSQEEEAAAAI